MYKVRLGSWSNDAIKLNHVNEAGFESSREMAKNFLVDSGLAALV